MAENNEVVVAEKKPLTFSESLTSSLLDVKEALPKDLNITRFVQNGVALLNDNKTLRDYAQTYGPTGMSNIKFGMIRAAYMGVDFMSRECYLIPYRAALEFRMSYIGAIKVCKKYSIRPIKDIYAKVVREGDEYVEEVVNGQQSVTFKPLAFNDKPIIGAFAVCLFEDGGMLIDSMSNAEIENTKQKAMTKNVWNDFPTEMTKKTVLHRLCKHIEIDFESTQQREIFNNDVKADFSGQEHKLNDPFADMEVVNEQE